MKALILIGAFLISSFTSRSQYTGYFSMGAGYSNKSYSDKGFNSSHSVFTLQTGYNFTVAKGVSIFPELGFMTHLDLYGIGYGNLIAGVKVNPISEVGKLSTSLFCGYALGSGLHKQDTHILPDGTVRVLSKGSPSSHFNSVTGGIRIGYGCIYAQTAYLVSERELFSTLNCYIPF